jgi:hypothetical protein
VLPEALHVGAQVPGGVVLEPRVRLAAAAATLIEQNDPVNIRIEEPAGAFVAPGARATMDEDNRLAVRVTAFLVENPVGLGYREDSIIEGLNLRV